jgi:hypothetical protein
MLWLLRLLTARLLLLLLKGRTASGRRPAGPSPAQHRSGLLCQGWPGAGGRRCRACLAPGAAAPTQPAVPEPAGAQPGLRRGGPPLHRRCCSACMIAALSCSNDGRPPSSRGVVDNPTIAMCSRSCALGAPVRGRGGGTGRGWGCGGLFSAPPAAGNHGRLGRAQGAAQPPPAGGSRCKAARHTECPPALRPGATRCPWRRPQLQPQAATPTPPAITQQRLYTAV